jgi:beta-glucosidase
MRAKAKLASLVVPAALAVMAATAGGAGASTLNGSREAAAQSSQCPWVTSRAPISQRVDEVMAQMTLSQKIAELGGSGSSAYVGHVPAQPSLCIPAINLEDGPAGVADGMTGVTQMPAPVAMASTWNPAMASAYGKVLGSEERGKGANVNLGPTINIVRDPRWGRAFESLSEDPYLTGQMGSAEIRGVQGQGVISQAKHLDVYNQETYRNTPQDNAIISNRAMHEIYLPAFHAAITQGKAGSLMCSYSTINGTYACQNGDLLTNVLRNQWHYNGFVTSDWGATHSTVPSANAGLDMQMPSNSYFGAALQQAVQDGQVSMATINAKVRHILTELFRFNMFANPPAGSPSAVVTSPAHAATARTVAEQGSVLLKNSGSVLPLSTSRDHSIAVIGPDGGSSAMTAGGGSASVTAPYTVTPYQGISKRAGSGAKVSYAEGIYPSGKLPAVPASAFGSGLNVTYYNGVDLSGSPIATGTDPNVDYNWNGGSPASGVPGSNWSATFKGTITPPKTGTYTFSLTSDDGSRLFINGQKVIDNWNYQAATTKTGTVQLTAGQPVSVEVDYFQGGGASTLSLGWQEPSATSPLDQAVALAKSSDVAVVFADNFESEGSDLSSIDLSADQNNLISAVAKANPNTIVVLNTGSAVTMPWVDQVKGVLEGWYPGQEDGNAIAALLFGDVNPSGHLPVTFPRSLSQVSASTPAQWPGVNGQVQYSEGMDVGYRWYDAKNITPLFPFGYGLSYTKFRYSNLKVEQASAGTPGQVTVAADVTNTGTRAGADVAQAYVQDPAAAGEPPIQLRAFRKVSLQPGQTAHVVMHLRQRAFQTWDSQAQKWTTVDGSYRVMVGDSSANLPLSSTISVSR